MSLNGLPLALASTGQRVEVTAIAGGREIRKRLCDLGLTTGKCLEVLQKHGGGPMVVALGESRFALGAGMAEKVLVIPQIQSVPPGSRHKPGQSRRGWFG
ncbi:FeoA family protein [Tropicimonas sp.]|uniref:FeoA family protein n=1 Tax=Tropicimonas sp. TaxID=2067044 RepID=UPI003A86B61E